jgi:hypothetical protein
MYKSLQGTFAFVVLSNCVNYCSLTFCFLYLQKKSLQAIGIEIAERIHAQESTGIAAGGAVPLSGLASTQNAQELARFMNQSATSAFTQVAMQQRMRGMQVDSTDIPFLEDGFIVGMGREIAQSELFNNNQRLQEVLGTSTECENADGSKFDARQAYRLNGSSDKEGKKTSHRSYNNRLDLSRDDSNSGNEDPEFAAAIAQSLLAVAQAPPATYQDQRKKPPLYSQQDQVKLDPHVAPANLQEPLGISAIAQQLFGRHVPSYDGTFLAPPTDNRKPPARISPPNPAPHIPYLTTCRISAICFPIVKQCGASCSCSYSSIPTRPARIFGSSRCGKVYASCITSLWWIVQCG